jgi:glyoxylase-like metal-dependent hydrolase (beta-lactamase superfamily II)
VHEDHVAGVHLFPTATVRAHRADTLGMRSLDGLMRMYGYGDTVSGMADFVVQQFHYAARPDTQDYEDGQVFDLGGTRIRAIHLPGHTRGHCALLVEPEGVLFLGDIDLTGFGPYYGDAWSDLADFEHSLSRVRAIDARLWVSFHHAGVVDNREAFETKLDRFAAKIPDRDAAICAYLREPHTLAEMVAHRFLYPPHATLAFVDTAERRTILQHLERLQREGRVDVCGPDTYRACAG